MHTAKTAAATKGVTQLTSLYNMCMDQF